MLQGKKTYLLSTLVAILAALQTDPSFAALTADHSGVILAIISALIAILRALTVTPANPSAK